LKRIRIFALLLFFFQGIALTGMAAEASEDGAVDVVAHFQSVLISVMKDAGEIGFKGRVARLEPEVRQSHDLARVAHLTIGRHWRALAVQQQTRFIDTFARLVIATYAHQFHTYSGESFKQKTVQVLKRGRLLVRTELIKSNGKRIHLDYVLYRRKGRWLIMNIIADGVSDLALKRVEYANVMRRDGFERLLSLLQGKIAQYN